MDERLLNLEGTWKTYILEKLPTDIRYLARCNINNADLPFKFRKDSTWQEVWTTWCQINYKKAVTNLKEIMNQNL